MTLCGEGAVCIWNDITPESEADFYDWHNNEHMPERVGIPGFLRGRRYVAADDITSPRYFTLYETETPEVIVGQDYLGRLNAPTPWTQRVTKEFRNTFRALTRVRASLGPGPGGALATLRMSIPDAERQRFERVATDQALPAIVREPMITGVHLCMTDMQASAGRTAETRDRTDIMEPPDTAVLIEGGTAAAVRHAAVRLVGHSAMAAIDRFEQGLYVVEYTRLKTAHTPG
jgi:hypothetical protein